MSKSNIILQDVFLNLIRKDKIPLMLRMQDSTTIRGKVKGFDNFTIILENGDKQMLIYKNAIAMIVPDKPILV